MHKHLSTHVCNQMDHGKKQYSRRWVKNPPLSSVTWEWLIHLWSYGIARSITSLSQSNRYSSWSNPGILTWAVRKIRKPARRSLLSTSCKQEWTEWATSKQAETWYLIMPHRLAAWQQITGHRKKKCLNRWQITRSKDLEPIKVQPTQSYQQCRIMP